MHQIKFGLFLPTSDYSQARQAALRAEADGFYSVSINDHFFTPFGPPATPQLECFTTLTAIAAETKTVKIGPSVAAASFRSPPLLAKIGSTLDQISNGRLILGVGAGWKREEYEAHGYSYPSNAERVEQLGEALEVLKAMWTQDEPSYKGRHFKIDKAYNYPRPLQRPHPPIMLGGSGSKLLKLAGKYADIINLIPPIFNGKDFVNDPEAAIKFDRSDLSRRIQLLHRFAREAGRDPTEIEIGSLELVSMSRNSDDPALRATAESIGFTDQNQARVAPVLLTGTPEQVRNEINSRMKDFAMSYHIIVPSSEESYELFVKEVMPHFSR